MTHRKGEKELNDRVEKTRKGRYLVIVTPHDVITRKLQPLQPGARKMEKRR